MKRNDTSQRVNLWIISILIILIIVVGVANYLGRLGPLHSLKWGPFYSHHWASLSGSTYIAVFIPVQRYLRSRNLVSYGKLLKFHVYGNLIGAGLITIHFAQHIRRPDIELSTGPILYSSLFLLVFTGILLRFGFGKARRSWWRYIHTGVTTAFYLIIIFHALHGFGMI